MQLLSTLREPETDVLAIHCSDYRALFPGIMNFSAIS